ncbi:molybdopterin-guanine dinucleotide biosynthesis protein B [Dysosmobacter sp.]|uniref:molybdopterin-guanine dinucleotide biosynthesis protein B n=1 Tax=Dysosmobacter sp. TaxID=2591382 RepID=UPI002A875CA1|nr:molybdopterin-guanine dinucleotide biosynthesis protein B [Dysosmobacter sp.]MDY3282168.1 molybdopterin-guanine dinucleotide biosynthesis protein B [Dysosmobacter sp.]
MTFETPSVGAVILAGGESRRMGTDKGALTLEGQRFLDRVAGELALWPERLVSVRAPEDAPACPGFTPVADRFPGCGPLGGLHAALSACRSDWLLAVACDMPLFRRELGEFLALFPSPAADACVPVDRAGRVHPLCALYGKSALPVLEAQLRRGDYRLTSALDRLRVRYVPLGHSAFGDETVANINTRADYLALLARRSRIPMAAVCGVKNAGKTAFLCGLLPELRRLGIRTAVIKHDGHNFEPDVPGTDSFRLRQAGAEPVAVYSARRYLLTARQAVTPEQLAAAMDGADLILLEGGKQADLPKIEIVRSAVSAAPVSDPAGLLAVCSDLDCAPAGVPRLALEDYAGAARLLAALVK